MTYVYTNVVHGLQCNECGKAVTAPWKPDPLISVEDEVQKVVAFFKQSGWLRYFDEHFCPECLQADEWKGGDNE